MSPERTQEREIIASMTPGHSLREHGTEFDQSRDAIGVRATAEERAAWESAAGDRKLSDWIRDTLNVAAARARPKSKP